MICRQQLTHEHAELTALAERLIDAMRARDVAAPDLPDVRERLTQVLMQHLATEDGQLYPALIESPIARTRWVATRFSAEMGGLARTFATYSRRWTPEMIAIDPEGYRGDTIAVMQALCARIRREEAELYPMIDPVRNVA